MTKVGGRVSCAINGGRVPNLAFSSPPSALASLLGPVMSTVSFGDLNRFQSCAPRISTDFCRYRGKRLTGTSSAVVLSADSTLRVSDWHMDTHGAEH